MARKQRLDPSIFHLPADKMREGYYSDKYFVRARELLRKDRHRPRVTMQVFGKSHAYLGGIDEAIAILKLCAERWDELVVHALYDGDEIEPWETVLLIEGPYDAFAVLETLYLGVLARRTRVGTNTHEVVEVARWSNEWEEATSFFDVTCWANLGENVAASLTKGSRAIVFGRLEQRSWDTDAGERRTKIEVIADEVGPSLRWAQAQVEKTSRSTENRDSGQAPTSQEDPY